MRILLDYRPALSERTGVGEYVHELTRALARTSSGDHITVFTSSLKGRPAPSLADELGDVRVVDRRVPVRTLTWAWNRLEWPPIEWLAGPADVVHAQSPLLIPAASAAQVVTIHDLDFLRHPERYEGEIRRAYPRLVRAHAARADHVVVSSHYVAREVVRHLELRPDHVTVCSPGAPEWAHAVGREREAGHADRRHILFVGTIEPRKNIPTLLTAYAQLRQRDPNVPRLVLAGGVRARMQDVLKQSLSGAIDGQVDLPGYVSETQRRALYRDAHLLVLPSLDEGFGLPVLEAMASGVPVVISDRGSLPEVAGDAARPVPADDADALSAEIARLLNPDAARAAVARGRARAAHYSWDACAAATRDAYRAAVAARERRAA